MTDIPIIMSAPMVRATLDGRKTNTRRLAWRDHGATTADAMNGHSERVMTPTAWQKVKPGDLLWVRETFGRFNGCGTLTYKADEDRPMGSPEKWKPAIHMPRGVSRITLQVTATKIERLQDISDDDVIAEGFETWGGGGRYGASAKWRRYVHSALAHHIGGAAPDMFQELWEHLHGPGSWDANPEVVAISFKVHKINIDEFKNRRAA